MYFSYFVYRLKLGCQPTDRAEGSPVCTVQYSTVGGFPAKSSFCILENAKPPSPPLDGSIEKKMRRKRKLKINPRSTIKSKTSGAENC